MHEVGTGLYFLTGFVMSLVIALISANVLPLSSVSAAIVAVAAFLLAMQAFSEFKRKQWPVVNFRPMGLSGMSEIFSYAVVLLEGVFGLVVLLAYGFLLLGGGVPELYAFVQSANLPNLLLCVVGMVPTLWRVANKN